MGRQSLAWSTFTDNSSRASHDASLTCLDNTGYLNSLIRPSSSAATTRLLSCDLQGRKSTVIRYGEYKTSLLFILVYLTYDGWDVFTLHCTLAARQSICSQASKGYGILQLLFSKSHYAGRARKPTHPLSRTMQPKYLWSAVMLGAPSSAIDGHTP